MVPSPEGYLPVASLLLTAFIIAAWNTGVVQALVSIAIALILRDIVKNFINSRPLPASGKCVVVFNAESDPLGPVIMTRLLDAKFRIVALVQSAQAKTSVEQQFSGNDHVIGVFDASAWARSEARLFTEEILPLIETHAAKLWGLVCVPTPAQLLGEFEWMPDNAFESVHSREFYPLVRLLKGSLPSIRECKGRIAVVSTAGFSGRQPMPGWSLLSSYHASLAALTESLRIEMLKWNVTVTLVSPIFYSVPVTNGEEALSSLNLQYQSKETALRVKTEYGPDYFHNFQDKINIGLFSTPMISSIGDGILSTFINKEPSNVYQPADLSFCPITRRFLLHVGRLFMPQPMYEACVLTNSPQTFPVARRHPRSPSTSSPSSPIAPPPEPKIH